MTSPTRACPGCGLELPVGDWPLDRRVNASPECWHLYTEVLVREAEHLAVLGHLHQLAVDAYGAQHAGDPSPPISTAFALIGLHLALEEGWKGTAVRAAHQFLAQRSSTWPTFPRPDSPGRLTVADVADVADADTPADHARLVPAWAASVWEAWRGSQAQVRSWARDVLPPNVRGRLAR